MSDLIATYDPNSPPAGMTGSSFKTQYLSTGIGTLVMWNNSDWEQDIKFPNGDTDVLPAWTAVRFDLTGPYGDVQWSQDAQLASVTTAPISQVKVVAYRSNETVPGVYPVALVRQTNIANAVNTNVSGTNSISNTGNAPLSNWLTVTPNDAGSTFLGDTSGNLTVKSDNAGVLTTLLQLIAGASPAVKIAAAAVLAEVLGNLKVDGTLESVGAATLDSTLGVTGTISANGGLNANTIRDDTNGNTAMDLSAGTGDVVFSQHPILTNNKSLKGKDSGGTAHDLLYADGANGVDLQAIALGGNVNIKDQDGSTIAGFLQGIGSPTTGNGTISVGKILFNIGGIKDLNTGTVAASGTVNHGLSGAPAAVLMTPDVAGSTWTVSANTYTSTQFSCTLNSALTTRWVAYR